MIIFRARIRLVLAASLGALALVAAGCSSQSSTPGSSSSTDAGVSKSAAAGKTVTLVAAGDISCDPTPKGQPPLPIPPVPVTTPAPGCEQSATAQQAQQVNPDAVVTMGDNQYNLGQSTEYTDAYAYSWGALKSITHPTPGNHDYDKKIADPLAASAGYFGYFGAAAGPADKGYYSFDLGSWHLIALNTNDQCKRVSCAASSPQIEWLKADLAASQQPCTLAYFHQPLFSTSMRRGSQSVKPIWDALSAANADVVLNAHEHHYERFAPQDPSGKVDTGNLIREFVVGTGGEFLDGTLPKDIKKGDVSFPEPPAANSQVRLTEFGILDMDLRPDSYSWKFLTLDGKTSDQGSNGCKQKTSTPASSSPKSSTPASSSPKSSSPVSSP